MRPDLLMLTIVFSKTGLVVVCVEDTLARLTLVQSGVLRLLTFMAATSLIFVEYNSCSHSTVVSLVKSSATVVYSSLFVHILYP